MKQIRTFNGEAKCPFYLAISEGVKGRNIGIRCEDLSVNLGFEVYIKHEFKTRRDMTDYFEIFCADSYKTCPYFIALINSKYKDI